MTSLPIHTPDRDACALRDRPCFTRPAPRRRSRSPPRPRSTSRTAIHPAERPDADRARGPQGADRRGEHLVPRRLQERAAGPHRLRAPVRAPDVQRERALRQGLFQGPLERAGATEPERHDQRRPHQLLPERADLGARPRAVARVATAWATCSARSTRPSSTSSAAWCRTRSARARTSPTARCGTSSRPGSIPATIRIRGPPSARWRTWTRAKLDDVKEWFQTYYGPANAVLVIAGDIDAARRRRRRSSSTSATFPPGPPIARQEHLDRQAHRQPARHDAGPRAAGAHLQGLERPRVGLGGRRLSRRSRRRVLGTRQVVPAATSGWCTTSRSPPTSDASVELREIGGLFSIEAGVRPGVDPAEVERAIDEELARFLAGGPTAVELAARRRRSRGAGFIRGVERIGGFGGKSDVLAKGEVFAGRPDFYKVQIGADRGATAGRGPPGGRRLALRRRVHADGRAVPRLQPSPRPGVDRSRLPACRNAARRRVPRARARRRCRTASRSCSPSGARFRWCTSTCCSTPASPPTSSPGRARPAWR